MGRSEPISAAGVGRPLTEAELEQRREAARKSAEARRLRAAPEMVDRWGGLTPDQKGATLFFLRQSSKNRISDINKLLKDTKDENLRSQLEGERRDLESALAADDILKKMSAQISAQAEQKTQAREAKKTALEQEKLLLQKEIHESTDMIRKMELSAQVRQKEQEIRYVTTTQAQIDRHDTAKQRAELQRIREVKEANQKAWDDARKREAEIVRSQRERENIAKREMSFYKKIEAAKKREAAAAKKAEKDKKKAKKR